MRICYLFVFVFYTIGFFAQPMEKTPVYIIGTVDESSSVFTPENLFSILDDIKPQVILQENDSKQLAEYTKEIRPTSNEQTATLKYLKKYPKTLNLPFEFEGRNQFRKDHGMVPADVLTIRLLDSLYKEKALQPENMKIYAKYEEANQALKEFAKTDIQTLNGIVFENLNRYRQNIQHHEIPKITNSEPVFLTRYITKPDGEKISYREGYQFWCNFWDLRNNSMAINILRQANEHKGKHIVVLTGVQHKYYLKELLLKFADGSYELKEYFKEK